MSIKLKLRRGKSDSKKHWLDHGEDFYGKQLVKDVKTILNVLVIYIPLPLFWALHAQQASRWVFQATKMNGNIGFYSIKPDQMIVLNSFLALLMIPMFEQFIYPLLSHVGVKTSLQKIVLGAALSAVAFVIAGLLELQIEKDFISILWMFPQFLTMAMAEILLYTANLNFSYTEAPADMKSVMLSFMYMTSALGCLIVVFISGVAFFESQAYEFFFFAGIMFIDTCLLGFLVTRYKQFTKDTTKTVI